MAVVRPSPPLKIRSSEAQTALATRVGLIAVALASIACVLLALNYKNDLAQTRAVLDATRVELLSLKDTIVSRCQTRARIDKASNDSVQADALLYRQLLEIAERAPRQTDPRLAALVAEQRAVIREAQVRKEAAAAAGTVGSCDQYR